MRRAGLIVASLLLVLGGVPAHADDGYRLWLRYDDVKGSAAADRVEVAGRSPVLAAAASELRRGLPAGVGRVLLATGSDPRVPATTGLGDEGYRISTGAIGGRRTILVAGNTDRGALYGAFALLRQLRSAGTIHDATSRPALPLRMLDHWDNLDGVVERGYAGRSLWDWWTLPDYRDPRYTDYARANASIGINAVVLNNVNASALSLTPRYIAKAAALADMFRPWGTRVYLSARFSAPIELGGLRTADPKNPAVAAWWAAKADEIYRAIPDFGGFLVKANSEGQPGPRDYGASHADGANMLAAALRPHGGTVMWRAFVYADTDPDDRAKQAYDEFAPLDGRFAANVVVQVKNGAIDFQPREPAHPLFGAMPRTRVAAEFQITKEYLGFATHLAYLAPLFAETLRARDGRGRVAQGIAAMAGVANVGASRDWSGSTFDQANWYAFGRLAWDPTLSPEDIAREWAAQTFGRDPRVVAPVVAMMLRSREAVVDYTGALGLAHLMGTGHHYGPAPWVADQQRPEWNPVYYHRADRSGIGFDRTKTGSNAIAQYAPPIAAAFADPRTTPETMLLWFHHLPWVYRTKDGATLWDTLVRRYDRGVGTVDGFGREWAGLRGRVDEERWEKTARFLAIQAREARWWRDASIAYWQSLNRLPLPAGAVAPAHDLSWYKAQRFSDAPGNPK